MKPKASTLPSHLGEGAISNVFSLAERPGAPLLGSCEAPKVANVVLIAGRRNALTSQASKAEIDKSIAFLLTVHKLNIARTAKRPGISARDFGIALSQKIADLYVQGAKP